MKPANGNTNFCKENQKLSLSNNDDNDQLILPRIVSLDEASTRSRNEKRQLMFKIVVALEMIATMVVTGLN